MSVTVEQEIGAEFRAEAEAFMETLDSMLFQVFMCNVTWQDSPDIWPIGVCTSASLLSVPMMRVGLSRPDLKVVIGRYEESNHCWVRSEDGWILDPTFGQFEHGQGLPAWLVAGPDDEVTNRFTIRTLLTQEDENFYRDTCDEMGGTHIAEDYFGKKTNKMVMAGY